jgi:hypothetical protein
MSRTLTALAALAVLAGTARADEPKAQPKGQPIDVVICLDVSGSMQGLAKSAQMKLWDVVNDLAKVQPTPDLRVALYSYGGSERNGYFKNVGWVRRDLDLTTDLDALYAKLNALKIGGSTEYVTRVCTDALKQQKWSADPKALKLIFVCGNEPADQDKTISIKEAARAAIDQNVIINCIFAGPANHPEAVTWKELAKLAEGRFANIDQDRGVVAIAAPQDRQLTELSAKLNTTYLAYGKEGQAALANQKAQDANAEKAGPGAAPARAAAKGGGLYRNERWDVIDRMKQDPNFDIKKVPADELCDELKKLTPEEREKYVKEVGAKRLAIQNEITELSKARDDYIRAEMKKRADKGDQGLDAALRGAIRDQAAAKGIKVPE